MLFAFLKTSVFACLHKGPVHRLNYNLLPPSLVFRVFVFSFSSLCNADEVSCGKNSTNERRKPSQALLNGRVAFFPIWYPLEVIRCTTDLGGCDLNGMVCSFNRRDWKGLRKVCHYWKQCNVPGPTERMAEASITKQ